MNHQNGGPEDLKTMNRRTLPWCKVKKSVSYRRLELDIDFIDQRVSFLYSQKHFVKCETTII